MPCILHWLLPSLMGGPGTGLLAFLAAVCCLWLQVSTCISTLRRLSHRHVFHFRMINIHAWYHQVFVLSKLGLDDVLDSRGTCWTVLQGHYRITCIYCQIRLRCRWTQGLLLRVQELRKVTWWFESRLKSRNTPLRSLSAIFLIGTETWRLKRMKVYLAPLLHHYYLIYYTKAIV